MKTDQFCFWLQGLFELAEPEMLTAKQTELIRSHLALVFYHDIDPSHSDDPEEQKKMQDIHDGKPKGPGFATFRPDTHHDRKVRC